MASFESKLHDCIWKLQYLLFPGTDIVEPFYDTIPGEADKKNDSIQLLECYFPFCFSTLTKMEKFRWSFRSKVNNINNFFAWTTYFSPRFQEEVEYFDPFDKSEKSSLLQELNQQIYQLSKELHQSDGSEEIFGIFDHQADKPLLFMFDMRKECPNFSVYLFEQSSFLGRKLLYFFFLRDRRNSFKSFSKCLTSPFPDFSVS